MSTLFRLFSERPDERKLDFATERFVVARSSGLTVNGVKLGIGQEVPKGTLSPDALRREYQRPLCNIDTIPWALKDPLTRKLCIENGVVTEQEALVLLGEAPPQETPKPAAKADLMSLDHLSRKELYDLCEQHGLKLHGDKEQLKARLARHLG